MADYTPVFLPGEIIPLTASGTVAGGDLVAVSGSGTVAKAAFAANPAVIVGVAAHDAVATQRLSVYARGTVHESVAQGTVTAGDLVTTPITGDTAGAQVKTGAAAISLTATWDAAAATAVNGAVAQLRGLLGVALTTATNPAKVRWMSF